MKIAINIILVLIGIALAVIGNWPPITKKYFPFNLILCVIGGYMAGWFTGELIWG